MIKRDYQVSVTILVLITYFLLCLGLLDDVSPNLVSLGDLLFKFVVLWYIVIKVWEE